ncbi:PheS-related mystery ligase SrmL [Streptomyces atroolivaceus]|uniref:PheS-related mystery ligase SrmL n=1 Tax=Streptomyces atroolivaceus TaxID=66869 RepID=UPI00379DA025
MPAHLSAEQLAHDLSIRDLSDPADGPHALQIVLRHAVDALADRWGSQVRWWRGERTVTVEDNYDNLGYRPDDITRDTRYTRYVDDQRMLRSHSSALIPSALRALAAEPADDVLLVCPGLVYRRDSIDRLHTGMPHQVDLWRLTRRSTPMTTADLGQMVTTLLDALLPGAEHRHEDRVHPYTLSGRQVDVDSDGEWIEVAECGLAHPKVLERAGLDASWSGLALGMGLDRMLMLLKGIPDIRILRSAEPSVAAQMADLTPYRPVSAMPAVRRDLSVAVDRHDLAEDLGDRVRDALGPDADCVESVEILTETPCTDLPPQALERLGASPEQKNVLLKVVLRHLDRTLTDLEANLLRDRIYAAVHQGSTHQWATIN